MQRRLSESHQPRHLSLEKQFEALEQNSFCLIVAESSREICFLTESWKMRAGWGWGHLKQLETTTE